MSICTVVIVNWNSWGVLSICLEALQKQSFKNFGTIVLDNASDLPVTTDLLTRFPEVSFLQNNSNLGFAAANNLVINGLEGSEFVVLLNPDAFPAQDWLQQLVNMANTYPEFSMFASRQLMDGDHGRLDGDGDEYHISGLVRRKGFGQSVDSGGLNPREVFAPCAAAALYRWNIFKSVGGFDEDFFCYVEDVDLAFRFRLAGHRCLLVPNAIVYHVGSATTGGGHSDFAVYHGHRNLVWAFVKNMPGILFWVLLPVHLGMNIVSIVVFIVRGQGRVIIRAKWNAIKGLPGMWRKRKQIQSVRVASIVGIWRLLEKSLFWKK